MTEYVSFMTEEAIAAALKEGVTEENIDKLHEHFVILSEGSVVTVPHGFGVVMFMAMASSGYVFYTWYKAWQARRDYEVPQLYTHHDRYIVYNCIFRNYKSTHELYSRFLLHLLFSGMEMPLISSAAAFVWVFGRFWYMKGYYTGIAERRHRGWWHCLGFQVLQLGALRYALKHMFW